MSDSERPQPDELAANGDDSTEPAAGKEPSAASDDGAAAPSVAPPFTLSEMPTTIYHGAAKAGASVGDWLEQFETLRAPPAPLPDDPELAVEELPDAAAEQLALDLDPKPSPQPESSPAQPEPAPDLDPKPSPQPESSPAQPEPAPAPEPATEPAAPELAPTAADAEPVSAQASTESAAVPATTNAEHEPTEGAPRAPDERRAESSPRARRTSKSAHAHAPKAAQPKATQPKATQPKATDPRAPEPQRSRAAALLLGLGALLIVWVVVRATSTGSAPAPAAENPVAMENPAATENPVVTESPAPTEGHAAPEGPVALESAAPTESPAPTESAAPERPSPPTNTAAAAAHATAKLDAAEDDAVADASAPDGEPVTLTAYKRVWAAARKAKNCRQRGDAPGRLRVYVTFAPSGHVERTWVPRQLVNPMTRECVVSRFSDLAVPPFSGEPLTFGADVRLY